jgi:hypothetical protein
LSPSIVFLCHHFKAFEASRHRPAGRARRRPALSRRREPVVGIVGQLARHDEPFGRFGRPPRYDRAEVRGERNSDRKGSEQGEQFEFVRAAGARRQSQRVEHGAGLRTGDSG